MRMNKFNAILLLPVLFFLSGCTSNKQTKEGLPTIDVRRNYPEKRVCLTDIAYVEFLYLCSDNDDFLFQGTISSITENKVVVFDWSSGSILFFSRDGKPKSRFNRVGQGPEEHTHSVQLVYDEAAGELFVANVGAGLPIIQVYSSIGEHKRTIRLPEGTFLNGRLISFDAYSLFFYDGSMTGAIVRGEPDLSVEDFVVPFYRISKATGKALDYIRLPLTPVSLEINLEGRRIPTAGVTTLIKSLEGVLLSNGRNDTVFLFGYDRMLTPVLYKTPSLTSLNPVVFLNGLIDRGSFQFFRTVVVRPGEEFPAVFPSRYFVRNKRTGEIFRQRFFLSDYQGKEFVINPRGFGSIYEGGYVFELDLGELKEAYRENRLGGKLKELVTTLDEYEGNNVFMLLHFK